jgi:hypothetical protein
LQIPGISIHQLHSLADMKKVEKTKPFPEGPCRT